ncbi:MAG TPA: hypothetical protein VJ783_30765 [Pirellulales bacterium]|nr:hypothetical protein [Pirellulales bacterium]
MKRSRRALWILLATLAASLLTVDFSTRRGEVARRPPVAARNADKRSGARRRVVTGSLAALARDPSHSRGLQLVRQLNDPSWQGGANFLHGDYVSLAADARHSTGAELVARLNWEQDNHHEPANHRPVESGPDIAARQRLNAARMGWSGCAAYAFGCDHLGRGPEGDQQAMRASVRL